ncbi:hypothetical protein D3C77_528260 [compost metagenome]
MAKAIGNQIHIIQLLIKLRTGAKQQIQRQLRCKILTQQCFAAQTDLGLFKPKQAFGQGYRKLNFLPLLMNFRRLRRKYPFNFPLRLILLLHLVAPYQRKYFLWIDAAYNEQQHIARMIESVIARVQRFLRDRADGFHRTGNINMNRMDSIHSLNYAEIHSPIRIVLVHANLLADDPFFLLHVLIREIRMLHKINQRLQIF